MIWFCIKLVFTVFLYISIPICLVLIKEHFPPSPKVSHLYTPWFSPHPTALPVSPSDSVALVPQPVAVSLSLPWPQALSSLGPFSYQGLVSVKMKAIKSNERGNWNDSLKKSVWVYLLPPSLTQLTRSPATSHLLVGNSFCHI